MDVYVNTPKVRSSAQVLRNANTKLTEKLEAIRKVMHSVNDESTYCSPASMEAAEKFERMATKRIPEFQNIVEEYAKFLDTVAESHDKLVNVESQHLESTVEPMA